MSQFRFLNILVSLLYKIKLVKAVDRNKVPKDIKGDMSIGFGI